MGKSRFTSLEFDDTKGKDLSSKSVSSEKGKKDDRISEENKHFVADTRDAQYYTQRAEKFESAGYHEYALREYSAALGEDPLLLDAWVGQLLMLLQLEEYPEVRLWADKAMEKFPQNPNILAVKSVAVFRMGLHREAWDYSDTALDAKGESDLVLLFRGELMLAENRPASDTCFKKALLISEKKGLIHLRTGAIYLRYKKYNLAHLSLKNALAKIPKSAWAWYLLGTTQEQLGLLDQAEISFKQAVELSPHNKIFRNASSKKRQGHTILIKSFFRRLFNK